MGTDEKGRIIRLVATVSVIAVVIIVALLRSQQVFVVYDYCSQVRELIDSAKNEITVAVYLIRYKTPGQCPEELVEALVEARERNVSVTVITEDDEYNERAISFLRENNVQVLIPERFIHSKVVITDRCAVMGSHNWTYNAMHKNIETSVIVCGNVVEGIKSQLMEAVR